MVLLQVSFVMLLPYSFRYWSLFTKYEIFLRRYTVDATAAHNSPSKRNNGDVPHRWSNILPISANATSGIAIIYPISSMTLSAACKGLFSSFFSCNLFSTGFTWKGGNYTILLGYRQRWFLFYLWTKGYFISFSISPFIIYEKTSFP